ncbi:hypothetical protein [Mycobacterium celatum]|uniref:Calpain catalytic domain-containing protein n=1 Tax=Mycobacterium celatum TaxID=28045 RepID=A0A1X1RSU8_MYCCE|nr:hypothetical protein [Mycobacterium celatum]ORV14875.1 hypothetical protein AWB95_09765 [Mycobacterium celatum]PIB80129.1 hypothetical protein CQY23_05805 [Mycobacterium celatum]
MTAPGPLPSLSELQAWPTEHFGAIAEWCDAEADRWENGFTEVHQQLREADWAGQAYDSAVQRIETDLGKARGGCTALRDAAKILRMAGENEGFAKAAALRAVAEATAAGYVVGEDLSVTDTMKYTSWDQAKARRDAAREFAAEIRAEAASLMRIDQDIAARLPAAGAGLRAVRFDKNEGSRVQAVGFKTDRAEGDLPLYGPDGKPHPGDVLQRDVGDCYFEAAEIAVSDKNPSRITGMIEAGPDGKYYVTGLQDPLGNTLSHYPVTDKDIQEVLSHHPGQKVLWPVVLEAAEAKARGGGDVASGLSAMGGGGFPGDGLQQLAGKASYNWFPGGGRDETDLINALNSGKPVVMATSPSATPIGIDPHRDGLVGRHVYALSSAHRDPDGTVWAEIINPWQYNLGHGDSGVPGVIIDPATPGRAWLNLSGALSHHGVTAFVVGGG